MNHSGPDLASGRRLSVAPMMDCTDRHARYLHRLLTRRALLYTEMIHAGALVRGDARRVLAFHPAEHPVALQLGGCDPALLAAAARIGADFGYDEINLNVGCPSPRVQQGRFGACLMAEPAVVADCVAAMQAACAVPVTVKCRIGLGRNQSTELLDALVEAVAATGCRTFVVHARNAWLEGLSPRENRSVPPLRHGQVHALKQRRPELTVVINGGITTLAEAREQLAGVDGVMIGRAAYHTPWLLARADEVLWGDAPSTLTPTAVLDAYLAYARPALRAGTPPGVLCKPLQGLFDGLPGARAWRRALTQLRDPDALDRLPAYAPGADAAAAIAAA